MQHIYLCVALYMYIHVHVLTIIFLQLMPDITDTGSEL